MNNDLIAVDIQSDPIEGVLEKLPSDERLNAINKSDRDIILISLLEYFCQKNDCEESFFQLICSYLASSGIIESSHLYSNNFRKVRMSYIESIRRVIDKCHQRSPKLIRNEKIDKYQLSSLNTVINYSRYLSDFFEIEKIGEGGFGSVYKAVNKIDQMVYAVKKVPFRPLNKQSYQKILKEVKFLAQFNHPNIIRYYSTWIEFTDDVDLNLPSDGLSRTRSLEIIDKKTHSYIPQLFIQMEYCPMTLKTYLETRNYNQNKIDIEKENKKFRSILEAVKYIHSQGIIHRDLNPNNIFLDQNNNIKVGDFGISIKDNDPDVEIDSYGYGLYSSPEQLDKDKLTTKSDIYSLGIIYFELTTLFKTNMERILEINNLKKNHVDYEGIIAKMLNREPHMRLSIDELVRSL